MLIVICETLRRIHFVTEELGHTYGRRNGLTDVKTYEQEQSYMLPLSSEYKNLNKHYTIVKNVLNLLKKCNKKDVKAHEVKYKK